MDTSPPKILTDSHAWDVLLERAPDRQEVVRIAREFVASLPVVELLDVPVDCRPVEIQDESDIDSWNLKLADAVRDLWGTDRDGRVLTELSRFFLRASVRLSRIHEARRITHP